MKYDNQAAGRAATRFNRIFSPFLQILFRCARSHVHPIPRFYDVALMVGFAKSSRRVPLPPVADGNPVQLLDLSGFCLRSNLSSLLDETALIRESTDK